MSNRSIIFLISCCYLSILSCKTNKDIDNKDIDFENIRMKEKVTITDYLPQDATLDVTEQIQEVFNQVKENSTIIFPERPYVISKAMLLSTKGVTLKGIGKPIITYNNEGDEYAKYGTRAGMINIYNDEITVENLTLDQNFRGSGKIDGDVASIGGILIGGTYLRKKKITEGIVIRNCTIYDAYGDAISVFSATSNNIKIENNHIITSYVASNWTTAGVKGEQAINVTSGKGILIRNNIIEGALDDAIAIHFNAENVMVEKNKITTTGGRIFMAGINNGVVRDNEIEYIQDGSAAILIAFDLHTKHISTNNDIQVYNNKIYVQEGVVFKQGIKLAGCGENIEVRNNYIETADIQGTGIEIRKETHRKTGVDYFGNNILIRDNEVVNCNRGIQYMEKEVRKLGITEKQNIKSQRNVEINNNKFIRCNTGIKVERDFAKLKENSFQNCIKEKG
jgi:hypothetical protein